MIEEKRSLRILKAKLDGETVLKLNGGAGTRPVLIDLRPPSKALHWTTEEDIEVLTFLFYCLLPAKTVAKFLDVYLHEKQKKEMVDKIKIKYSYLLQ